MPAAEKSTGHVPPKWFWRVIRAVTPMALVAIVLLFGCQPKLIYFPRPYGKETVANWEKATPGKKISYQTSQGRQRAFLQGNMESPRNLWIVCGGNGTLALDWAEWLKANAPPEDAWLLVDFPGYGDCEGSPSPGRIRENMKAVVPLAAQKLGWPAEPDPEKLRFFGHSLGSAACLIAATEFRIQRGVLIAPFSSTMDMASVVTGLPIGFLVWHRFDNRARLRELAERGHGKVLVIHGAKDEVIPVAMSRKLAAEQKNIVVIKEMPRGRHNTIHLDYAEEVATAIREIGKAN